jgi:hypothetical protein
LVPLTGAVFVLQVCCSIVEERGLDTVGIYRVPGNSANVNYLTEQVQPGYLNKKPGLHEQQKTNCYFFD